LPSTLDLRRRIRSVRSTQQITRAMKMVAAARLRRAQGRLLETRPYAAALEQVLNSVASHLGSLSHPLLEERAEERVTLMVVTGDKGLCGAFNSTLLREAESHLGSGRWRTVELVLAGRKGIDFFRSRGQEVAESHPGLMGAVTTAAARALAEGLARRFSDGATDAIYVLFTGFRSIIQQQVMLQRLLPVERGVLTSQEPRLGFIFEPTPAVLFRELLPRYVEFQVLRMLLESQAAEHAARMTAMDAASRNASDMIDRLTLTYNRVRQASITKELIEIVSGAQALANR